MNTVEKLVNNRNWRPKVKATSSERNKVMGESTRSFSGGLIEWASRSVALALQASKNPAPSKALRNKPSCDWPNDRPQKRAKHEQSHPFSPVLPFDHIGQCPTRYRHWGGTGAASQHTECYEHSDNFHKATSDREADKKRSWDDVHGQAAVELRQGARISGPRAIPRR